MYRWIVCVCVRAMRYAKYKMYGKERTNICYTESATILTI